MPNQKVDPEMSIAGFDLSEACRLPLKLIVHRDFCAVLAGLGVWLVVKTIGQVSNNTHKSPTPPNQAMFNKSEPILQLPIVILDRFIPAYGMISAFIFDLLGFDMTFVGSLCGILWLINTFLSYAWSRGYHYFRGHCISTITVYYQHDLFDQAIAFLTSNDLIKRNRHLIGKTTGCREADVEDLESSSPGELINFKTWRSTLPHKYQFHYDSHRFWHNGRYFELDFIPGQGDSWPESRQKIKIGCIGRSPDPIKAFLGECQRLDQHTTQARTTLYRPTPRSEKGPTAWECAASRPSRPMSSVNLDSTQKRNLLLDINEHLQPSTQRWYSDRGILYRRGYLFYGPPGTGKSSLSFAVAGIFGLGIYTISLLDPKISEEALCALFNCLPSRCVVLLEDIDTAGLEREKDNSQPRRGTQTEGERAAADSNDGKSQSSISEKFAEVQSATVAGANMSISGLLNAIDGVASQEGRILLTTTNYLSDLDAALVRPGRFDLMVEFKLATNDQISELKRNALTVLSTVTALGTTDPALQKVAVKYAAVLPENTFSPAEIEGFLLTRKIAPWRAVKEVAAWSDERLKDKYGDKGSSKDKSEDNVNSGSKNKSGAEYKGTSSDSGTSIEALTPSEESKSSGDENGKEKNTKGLKMPKFRSKRMKG